MKSGKDSARTGPRGRRARSRDESDVTAVSSVTAQAVSDMTRRDSPGAAATADRSCRQADMTASEGAGRPDRARRSPRLLGHRSSRSPMAASLRLTAVVSIHLASSTLTGAGRPERGAQ